MTGRFFLNEECKLINHLPNRCEFKLRLTLRVILISPYIHKLNFEIIPPPRPSRYASPWVPGAYVIGILYDTYVQNIEVHIFSIKL